VTARRLLRRLAVFAGSFDLDAASWIYGDPGAEPADILDDLTTLVDWHLVEPAGGPADAPRFRLLDLLQEFGAEQLAADGDLAAAQESLLSWSLDFAEQAIAGLDSPAERTWLERVDRELPNLRAALSLLRDQADAPRGARLAEALGPFWAHRGPMAEGRSWFTVFLDTDSLSPASPLSPRARAVATAWLVRLAIDEGELGTGPLETARDILAQHPDTASDWLRATEHLAYGLTMRGDLDAADELTAAGIERASRADLPYWECIFLLRRALSAQRHSQPEQAIEYARQTVLAAQAIGYERAIARADQIIAHVRAPELGREGTRLALIANLRAHELAGDLRGVASTRASLGAVTVNTDATQAATWLAGSMDLATRIGYWHGEAYCVLVTTVLLVRTGQPLEAAWLDGATQPYMTTLRASLPPHYYAGYLVAIDSARDQLGSAVFDQAAAGHSVAWPVIRARATAAIRAHAVVASGSGGSDGPGGLDGTGGLDGVGGSGASGSRRRGPRANPELTDRELEVLAAIASGQTNQEIASVLYLSAKTVMHHSTNVYRKLGVRGRAEAVALAYRTGLLSQALLATGSRVVSCRGQARPRRGEAWPSPGRT
jgi:DNA-binding CsgD family transcriptional regulator